jgi:hypothetical protein
VNIDIKDDHARPVADKMRAYAATAWQAPRVNVQAAFVINRTDVAVAAANSQSNTSVPIRWEGVRDLQRDRSPARDEKN